MGGEITPTGKIPVGAQGKAAAFPIVQPLSPLETRA